MGEAYSYLLGRLCEFGSVCGIEWLETESTDEAEEDKVQPVLVTLPATGVLVTASP